MAKNISIHPGQFLREDVIEYNHLTITEAAKLLGITRIHLSNILNEKTSISPNIAIRISKVFGGTPDIWLKLQLKYDLLHALEDFEKQKTELKEFQPI